jgi:hypothetical protein
VRQLQQRVEELQASALESRAAADDAEALNEALRADMDALRNRTAAAERRAHRAESACDQLRDRLAAISTASSLDSSHSAGAATTPGRVAALRERLRDTETDRDALRQRCELAEQRIAELESHRSLKSEAAMQAKLLAAQQRCEALQIRNDTLVRERDELQRQLTQHGCHRRRDRRADCACTPTRRRSRRCRGQHDIHAAAHRAHIADDDNDDATTTPTTIEQQVQALLREHAAHDIGAQLPANFHRIAPGVYQFGTRKIYLQLRNGALMARVGGGFVKLLDFIDRHGPQERIRLRRLASQFGDALNGTATATPAPAPAASSSTAYYSGTSPTLAAVHSSYAAARAATSKAPSVAQTPLMAAESSSNGHMMNRKPSPKWSRM